MLRTAATPLPAVTILLRTAAILPLLVLTRPRAATPLHGATRRLAPIPRRAATLLLLLPAVVAAPTAAVVDSMAAEEGDPTVAVVAVRTAAITNTCFQLFPKPASTAKRAFLFLQ